MSNHVKKFYEAVSVLGSHGHIKQRLIQAYEDNLAHIEYESLPAEVRQPFAELSRLMKQVEPLNGEGPIFASVRKMSIDQADDCARRIIDLYSDMIRSSITSDGTIPLPVDDRAANVVAVHTN